MAAVSKATIYVTGYIYWAKILGKPRPNYNKDGLEWAFEFEPDEDGIAKIKQHKLTDRLKDKYEDRGKFLVLRKTELNKDGNANPPIRVYNKDNEDWDQTKLIGNRTLADVKLDIRDYGPGKKKGVYPVAVRIKELVEYQSSEFGAMDGDDSGSTKPKDTFKEDFVLDDDLDNIV